MTVSPRFSTVPAPYVVGNSATFATMDGLTLYLKNELAKVAACTETLALMTPQPAVKLPPQIADGMIRLARSPWRPVSGQTVDEWVYYDAPSATWKVL